VHTFKKKEKRKEEKKKNWTKFFLLLLPLVTHALFIVARKHKHLKRSKKQHVGRNAVRAPSHAQGGCSLSLFRALRLLLLLLLSLGFVVFFPAVVDDVESQRPPR